MKQANSTEYISNPFNLIQPSWQAIRLNLKTWVLLGLAAVALFALPTALLGLNALSSVGLQPGLMVLAAVLIAAAVIFGALRLFPMTVLLPVAGAKGEKVDFKDGYNQSKVVASNLIGTTLLSAAAVIGGFILLVIPGLIFAVWFSLAPYICVNEGLGPVEAMKKSKELLHGRFWEQAGLMLLTSVFQVFRVIPFLGAAISVVVEVMYGAAPAVRYLQLSSTKPEDLPPVHPSNYLVVVLGLAATGFSFSQSVPNN